MGFGDKLKGLREQAQQAVVDNKDKIQGAVQTAGEVANTKTKGKYADKIMKVGEKVSGSVEKFAGSDDTTAGTSADTSARSTSRAGTTRRTEPGPASTEPSHDDD